MKESLQLKHYIERLGLPHACLPTIIDIYNQMDARIWVVENSYAMNKKDSHLVKSTANFDCIEKKDGVSRWSELLQCIDFHTKMAARCWIPTKYWLVNEPEGNLPKRFGLCWAHPDEVPSELEKATQIINNVTLTAKVNPLGRQLQKIEKYLSKESPRLREKDEFVGVVVCTQGVPTDEKGNKGHEVVKEFVKSLASLSASPVKIVFRLCTDNDKVVDFYNTLDVNEECECDVLDDFWGEAIEVYLHNPWLTYGIGIHRLREAGLGTELMDQLDEFSFSLEDIHEFCMEFFVGKNPDIPLENPCRDFREFVSDLQNILKREKLVWNPVKDMLCPWIDIEKLRKMFQRASLRGRSCRRESYCRGIPSMETLLRGRQNRRPRAEPPRRDFRRSQTMYNSQATPLPKPPFVRSSTDYGEQSKQTSNSAKTNGSTQPMAAGPKDLNEAIQWWSHKPPDFKSMHSLQRLLVEVPTLFPASNIFVEDHEYFNRWKEFSEDAFCGENREDLKELLRRAVRKAKFFLHPDKLPRNLTENQNLLFKSIWNIILESEAVSM